MKKVCFLLNNEFTHDNRVNREALALVRAGYEVTVIALHPPKSGLPVREIRGGINIHRLIQKPLFNYEVFQTRAFSTLGHILRHYRRFDFVHAHDFNTLFLGWALSRLTGAKLVYDSHEYWQSYFDEERKRLETRPPDLSPGERAAALKHLAFSEKFQNWLLPRCDGVISVSESLCQLLKRDSGNRIRHCLNLRNICEYEEVTKGRKFHEELSLPEECRIVLYQGGLTEVRGILQLLDAMEQIRTPNAVLVLMGRANRGFFKKLSDRISHSPVLRERVIFKQMVPSAELLSWTSSADIGIHPILDCRTNHHICLPNKVFEYIQAEIPLALSQVPEMQKIVEEFGVGFTFDPEDPSEIARKLDHFLTNPSVGQAYRLNAQKAKKVLCWENEQAKLLAFYHNLGGLPYRELESFKLTASAGVAAHG